MAQLTENTVKTYTLKLSEEEAQALVSIVGVFWPNGVVRDILDALVDTLGELDYVAATPYDGSVFENKVIESEVTYKLDDKRNF